MGGDKREVEIADGRDLNYRAKRRPGNLSKMVLAVGLTDNFTTSFNTLLTEVINVVIEILYSGENRSFVTLTTELQ